MYLSLLDVISAMEGEPADSEVPVDMTLKVTGYCVELADVSDGAIFFALAPPDFRKNYFNFTGGDSCFLIPSAFRQGALACVMRADSFLAWEPILNQFRKFIFLVDDVIWCMQKLAKYIYSVHQSAVIGVTGSAGKTSTKELISFILSRNNKATLSTFRNRNNGIGHPLTVMQLAQPNRFDYAVLELGMSSSSCEIDRLCSIAPPSVAIVTNVLPVHMKWFEDIKKIAYAKSRIVAGLKNGGVAILNADMELVSDMAVLSSRVFTFGIKGRADFSASKLIVYKSGYTSFYLSTPFGNRNVNVPVVGLHWVYNVLAAVAACCCVGLDIDLIVDSLWRVDAPIQRGNRFVSGKGVVVIDDSYNSNPVSLLYAIEAALYLSGGGSRLILVMGDMSEIGISERSVHEHIGDVIGKLGLKYVLGFGPLSKFTLKSIATVNTNCLSCASIAELHRQLAIVSSSGDVVLIKGSRIMALDRLVKSLK